jgi:hypothetical protein
MVRVQTMRIRGSERAARTLIIIGLDLREGQTSTFRIVEFAIDTLLFLGNNSTQKNEDRVDSGQLPRVPLAFQLHFVPLQAEVLLLFRALFLREHMVLGMISQHRLGRGSTVRHISQTGKRCTHRRCSTRVSGLAFTSKTFQEAFDRPLCRGRSLPRKRPLRLIAQFARRDRTGNSFAQASLANVSLATIWL